MPTAWSKKDERMYSAIKKSCLERDNRQTKACPRIAAATVNKRRREEGRTLSEVEGFFDFSDPLSLLWIGSGIVLVGWLFTKMKSAGHSEALLRQHMQKQQAAAVR